MTVHIFIGKKTGRKYAVIVRESCCNKEMQQHNDQKKKNCILQYNSGARGELLSPRCASHLLVLSSQALVDTGWLHLQVPASRKGKVYVTSGLCMVHIYPAYIPRQQPHHLFTSNCQGVQERPSSCAAKAWL